MCIRVAGQRGKDHPVQKVTNVDHRYRRPLADQAKAVLQRGPSFLLILAGGGKPQCLTKILLMQSLDTAIWPRSPIVSFDDKARGLADDLSVAFGHPESDLARQGHAPGFVGHQSGKTRWLRFENVRARCFVQRQRDPHFGWSAILRDNNRKFDLCPR